MHPLAFRLLYDPQTSGGLLLAVAPEKAERLVKAILDRGVSHAAVIGEVIGGGAGAIRVVA